MIPPGTRVTCAYRDAHVGIVLDMTDPRAWAGSIRFPTDSPSPTEVIDHVAWCWRHDLFRDGKQPVLWPWGVMWDRHISPVECAA